MFIKSQVELIYESQGVVSNGSPYSVYISKIVRCDEMETFSNVYYSEQSREMRLSRNLVIPTYLTEDVIQDGKRYELMYCMYDGKKYKVRNILKYRANKYAQGSTRQKMILDIQELR